MLAKLNIVRLGIGFHPLLGLLPLLVLLLEPVFLLSQHLLEVLLPLLLSLSLLFNFVV